MDTEREDEVDLYHRNGRMVFPGDAILHRMSDAEVRCEAHDDSVCVRSASLVENMVRFYCM